MKMKKLLSVICVVVLILTASVTANAYSEDSATIITVPGSTMEADQLVIRNDYCGVNYGTIKLTGDTTGLQSGGIVLYNNSVLINRGTIEGDDSGSASVDPIIPEDYGRRIVSYQNALLINYGLISKTKMVNYGTLIFAEGSSGDSVITYGTVILAQNSYVNIDYNGGNKIDCNSDSITLDISKGDITIASDGFFAYGCETKLAYTGNYNIVGSSETNSLVIESVAEGKTVTVPSNNSLGVKDLTIGSGVTLGVEGTLTVYGTTENNGKIDDHGNHDFVNRKCRLCGLEGYEQGMSVSYSVAPTYTVTIPETVTLGKTAEIKAENVVIPMGKKVAVKLTATDGESNAFTLKTAEGAIIGYTVSDSSKSYALGDAVLEVNPKNANNGAVNLNFTAAEAVKYAGSYKGTVTFTITIEEE